jgi:endogenous inhibitor of DNA gyrase (YacG/DUF329 family)
MKNNCRCGVELPTVKDNETPPQFCSEKCRIEDAAPDLLAAAKWALAQRNYAEVAQAIRDQCGSPVDGGVWLALENAIKKAEGK